MSSIPQLGLTPDHDLGAVHTLPEFRTILDSSPITEADRETIADQAEAMIDGLYVAGREFGVRGPRRRSSWYGRSRVPSWAVGAAGTGRRG